ncbi:hypothetical protein BWI15_11010 [Kribbella sp. ALI-6-A]|nr:hypothetical protein BWI15_11010 [Kribbella sp. ALI-6-A]
MADGMFFVGIDAIGDKVVEINAETRARLSAGCQRRFSRRSGRCEQVRTVSPCDRTGTRQQGRRNGVRRNAPGQEHTRGGVRWVSVPESSCSRWAGSWPSRSRTGSAGST